MNPDAPQMVSLSEAHKDFPRVMHMADIHGRVVILAYAGPVVQAFRRPWCIDSGFMVHAFR